jgi:hypothetical protein
LVVLADNLDQTAESPLEDAGGDQIPVEIGAALAVTWDDAVHTELGVAILE